MLHHFTHQESAHGIFLQEQLEEADIVLSVVFGAFSMEQPTNVEFGLNIGYPFSEIPYALKSQNEQVCIQPVYNSQTCKS